MGESLDDWQGVGNVDLAIKRTSRAGESHLYKMYIHIHKFIKIHA